MQSIVLEKESWTKRLPQTIVSVVTFPLRTAAMVRRSATIASISLLLFTIVSINVLWGYPWSGIFAACISTLAIGLCANQFMQPRLNMNVSLPRSIEAEQTFGFRVHLRNRRRLPALQLVADLDLPPENGPSLRSRKPRNQDHPSHCAYEVLSDASPIPKIGPGESVTADVKMRFWKRGIHTMPDMTVKSMFPFCLFEYTTRIPSQSTVAVTPKRLYQADDSAARGQLSELAAWISTVAAADTSDYAGSREYQYGMPVQRWDYASWARLGKPIVQEFQSPRVQTVCLIVDTAVEPHHGGPSTLPGSTLPGSTLPGKEATRTSDANPSPPTETIETVFSFAATCLTELFQRKVSVKMLIAGESIETADDPQALLDNAHDLEAMLIRLAMARHTPAGLANQHLEAAIASMPKTPTLLLSARQHFPAIVANAACKRIFVP